MKTNSSFIFFLFFLSSACFGQVVLPYFITAAAIPADTAKNKQDRAPGSTRPGYFSACGLRTGEISPDFVLYDTAGKACQLSLLLAEKKPVLLVAVSLTCPQSRKSMKEPLSTIYKRFGNSINIRLIYVIDAHPVAPDNCPYSDAVYTTTNNLRDSILFLQPKTYLDRKNMAKDFILREEPPVPVLIDGPDNAYWKTFGPAPNNAYLIAPGGMIYKKYAWFENPQSGILRDIPALLASPILMKTDFSKEAWIAESKTTGDTSLFVKDGQQYELSIQDKNGKNVFFNRLVITSELNLEKIKMQSGDYSLVIKTTAGLSYCIRYTRP